MSRNITICISPELFEELAPAIEGACSRLGCCFYLGAPRKGSDLLLCITSEKKYFPIKDAKKAASELNVPVLEIDAGEISGETGIYEMLKPFVSEENTTDISSLLQLRFPDRIVPRGENEVNSEDEKPEEENEERPSSNLKPAVTALGFILGIAFIIIIALISSNSEKNNRIAYLNNQVESTQRKYNNLSSDYSSLKSKNDETEKVLSEISEVIPFIIKDVSVGNMYEGGSMETDYGKTIYSSNTMFLAPKLKYYGLKSGSYKIQTYLHTPSGNVTSYSNTVSLYKGNNTVYLSGWGNKNKGHWGRGQYHYVFYCEGKSVYTKYFTIY